MRNHLQHTILSLNRKELRMPVGKKHFEIIRDQTDEQLRAAQLSNLRQAVREAHQLSSPDSILEYVEAFLIEIEQVKGSINDY
jgi:hypothetical protein